MPPLEFAKCMKPSKRHAIAALAIVGLLVTLGSGSAPAAPDAACSFNPGPHFRESASVRRDRTASGAAACRFSGSIPRDIDRRARDRGHRRAMTSAMSGI